MGLLPPDTTFGPATLRVASLDRSLAFYRDMLGFGATRDADGTSLAAGENPLLRLREQPGLRQREPNTNGLYHVALLYPDRRDLARTLLRLFEHRVPFQGFADHGVSEAAYLADPDGNGIELAADRPRSEWKHAEDGSVVMVTHVLNVTGLLRAVDGDPWIGPPDATRVGHVHLHVSDLSAARAFYADVLGFAVTNERFPGALFLAAGGYHHHIAVNTWGHGPAADDAVAGLDEFTIVVPDPAAREALSARLAAAGAAFDEDGAGLVTRDPDGNRIRVR